jgi:hypothetical protein
LTAINIFATVREVLTHSTKGVISMAACGVTAGPELRYASRELARPIAGALLARVERLHMRVTGTAPQARVVPAWQRSLSEPRSVQLTVLDRIMVASVLVAVIAMGVWFFAFAGSSLPT